MSSAARKVFTATSIRGYARWNRSAVPFNLVYVTGKREPTPLPEILTPGIVLGAFASPGN